MDAFISVRMLRAAMGAWPLGGKPCVRLRVRVDCMDVGEGLIPEASV